MILQTDYVVRLSKVFESLVDEFKLERQPSPNHQNELWENDAVSLTYSAMTNSLSLFFRETESYLYLILSPSHNVMRLAVVVLGTLPVEAHRPLAVVDRKFRNTIHAGLLRVGETKLAEQIDFEQRAIDAGDGPIYG